MILISPYSKGLRNGKRNPKNYPWFSELVKVLQAKGHQVTQLGIGGEQPIGADKTEWDLSLDKLGELIEECDTWVSVDNFFHHYCASLAVKGVVIFGPSDPNIYGHDTNVNLLKDRKYLRQHAFGLWESLEYSEDRFVDPMIVAKEVFKIVREKNGNS